MRDKVVVIIPGLYYSLCDKNGKREWLSNSGFAPATVARESRRRNRKRKKEEAVPDDVAERSVQSELQIPNL